LLFIAVSQILKYCLRFVFFLLSAFLFPSNITAQVTRVTGKITDAVTNETLPFVNIVFKGTTVGTSTDINGYFEIQAQRALDTIVVSFMGYRTTKIGVKRLQNNNGINIKLKPENYTLKEVVILPGENPAHRIMRKVVANKENNNPEQIKAYQYEAYNKIEFDINNYNKKLTKKKMFKPFNFVFDYSDTTEDGKAYLPIALTETFTNVYFRADAPPKKEIIKASQISGIKNNSASQFLGDMYQNINIYDNFLLIFNKSFVSPITDNFLRYYKYYLVDSVYIDNERCYKLLFLPKRKQDLTFKGDIYIHDSTFAVKRVSLEFNDNANINFIKQFAVRQDFQRVDGKQWMLTKEISVGDFAPFEKANGMGIYGRKTSTYQNFILNKPYPDSLFKAGVNIVVNLDAADKNDEYWSNLRPDSLSTKEKNIYIMVDSLKQVPRLVNVRYLAQMLATGFLHWNKFDIGQYYTFYSWNDIEGNRVKFGGVTSNDFSKRLEIRGALAYGFKDERFKPRIGFRWFVQKDKTNRRLLTVNYKSDLEQLSLSANSLQLDNILTSAFRRTALTQVTNVRELRVNFEYEWFTGFMNKITMFNRNLLPLGDFKFQRNTPEGLTTIKDLTTTEFSILTRFAFQEKYISGEFDRTSLGSKYPVLQFELGLGVPNIFSSQFSYVKARFGISDRFRINPLGYTDYVINVGKIWGTAPYLFLELHQGSQTYALDPMAFNMMNIFEFASDRYAYFFLDHHFEGFFLNKVPLLRKLKWREVFTIKSVIGDMSKSNLAQLTYPGGLDPQLQRPYLESGFAVENIFKIVRIDWLWRMTHLERPNAKRFGVRVSMNFRF
jgi:hypothetical protein